MSPTHRLPDPGFCLCWADGNTKDRGWAFCSLGWLSCQEAFPDDGALPSRPSCPGSSAPCCPLPHRCRLPLPYTLPGPALPRLLPASPSLKQPPVLPRIIQLVSGSLAAAPCTSPAWVLSAGAPGGERAVRERVQWEEALSREGPGAGQEFDQEMWLGMFGLGLRRSFLSVQNQGKMKAGLFLLQRHWGGCFLPLPIPGGYECPRLVATSSCSASVPTWPSFLCLSWKASS